MATAFKGYTKGNILFKIEKYIDDQKVGQCGIDSEKNFESFGAEQPLRGEYEAFVAGGKCPVYIEVAEED